MDDLLDLSFGAPAAGQTSAQGAAARKGGATGLRGTSAFDLFAASSAQPIYRGGRLGMAPAGPAAGKAGNNASASNLGRGSSAVPSRTNTPGAVTRPAPAPAPSAAPAKSQADAFSSLLDFVSSSSAASAGSSTQNVSLAEQAAQRAQAARDREEEERARFDFAQMGFGGSEHGVGRSGSAAPPPHNGSPEPVRRAGGVTASHGQATSRSMRLDDVVDVWDAPATNTAPRSMSSSSSRPVSAARVPVPPQDKPPARDPWDFDNLDAPRGAATSLAASRSETIGVGDADDGDGDDGDDDDDVLGMLSKPVDHFAPATPAPSRPTSSTSGSRPSRHARDDITTADNRFSDSESSLTADVPRHAFTPQPRRRRSPSPSSRDGATSRSGRPASPPPHIIGQLVEMGFGVLEARRALQATEGGVDVQAALEALLAAQGGSGRGTPQGDRGEDDERRRREEERRRKRRQGPTRANGSAERADAPPPGASGPSAALPADLTEHADRLLSSATVLGRGMLSKASGLWATGKERALKAYEENARAGGAGGAAAGEGGRAGGADGRPRWMVDAQAREEGGETHPQASGSPRKEVPAMKWDDSDDEAPAERATRGSTPPGQPRTTWDDDAVLSGGGPSGPVRGQQERSQAPRPARAPPSNGTSSAMSVKEKTAALFSEAAPAYRSAGRRAGPSGSGRGTPQSATPRASTPARPPSPLRTRPVVPVTPAQLARSAQHKAKGNDEFKLGRFSEAAASYTVAIDALPEGQLLRVPLHTNRATAHLKSGGHSEAIVDCSVAIDVIGLAYHPAKEAPLAGELAEVKLSDGLVKALNKRATGYEMAEKWDRAKEDWEALTGVLGGSVGVELGAERTMKERAQAAEGIARCRKMMDVLAGRTAKSSAPRVLAAKSRGPTDPPTRSATPADPNASAAVSRLRQAAQAQESEDAQRLALKDTTDARLLAWSAGKETNLRGLLSSLDGVLGGDDGWKALGIKKLNIADLITEKQVKMGYMRVIGKLHPDKLNVTTTTLGQRMIANGVFGTLNEAWHAFNK